MFDAVTNEFEVVFHNLERELVEKSKTAQILRFSMRTRSAGPTGSLVCESNNVGSNV